jgi:hypothetical protein
MKKIFCVLSLVFGALGVLFAMVYMTLLFIELLKKVATSNGCTIEKIKHYVADKLEVVKVEADDVIVKTESTLES